MECCFPTQTHPVLGGRLRLSVVLVIHTVSESGLNWSCSFVLRKTVLEGDWAKLVETHRCCFLEEGCS